MITALAPVLLFAAAEVTTSPLTPLAQTALVQRIGSVGTEHPCYDDETVEVSLLLSERRVASEIEVVGPPCARHEVEAIKRFLAVGGARYLPVGETTRFRFRIRLDVPHAAE